MSDTVVITISGVSYVLGKFDDAADKLRDMRPVWQKIHQDLLELEEEVFASEGAAINQSWPALSSRYARWKAKNFPGRGMMVLGSPPDNLKSSLTQKGHPAQVDIKDPDQMVFGSQFKVGRWNLAEIHQKRATKKRATVPTDQSMLPRGRVDRWLQWMAQYLEDGLQ